MYGVSALSETCLAICVCFGLRLEDTGVRRQRNAHPEVEHFWSISAPKRSSKVHVHKTSAYHVARKWHGGEMHGFISILLSMAIIEPTRRE